MRALSEHFGIGTPDAPTLPHNEFWAPRRPDGQEPPAAPVDRRRRRRIIRRLVALGLVAILVPTTWSFYRAVSAPGTDPFTARSVEWLKDHGMNGVVISVEHWWYTHHAPPVGGKLKHGLPHGAKLSGNAQAKHAKTPTPAHLPPPTPMQPLVAAPLPGEGQWTPTGRAVEGLPAVYTSYFRPDAFHTGLVAAAMWMDTTLLNTVLIPGLQQPGGPVPFGGQVPQNQFAGLVAAFNSGFKVQDSRGGYYAFGHEWTPLVNGAASLVVDSNGKASVGLWGRDFTLSPNIQTVRQNLSLLVDNGQPVPGLGDDSNAKWGGTVGNKVFVWRSGVGVDAHGGLIYVAGDALSIPSLAILLQRAGAVRAMELDINSAWVSAFTFSQNSPNPADIHGNKLLPGMQRADDRYLVPGERDFFALFAAH